MPDIGSLNLSETKNTAGGFLVNQHGEPPRLQITDGMEPQVSTVETAAIKPSGETPISGNRPRGNDTTAGDSGSRTAPQRPRSPLFRQR